MKMLVLSLQTLVVAFMLNSALANAESKQNLVIPENPRDVVLITDYDYTLVGDAVWTPIYLYLQSLPHSPLLTNNDLPRDIALTERELNSFKHLIGTSNKDKPSGVVDLMQDPVGLLLRPTHVELGRYYIDESLSYGAFRDSMPGEKNQLLEDFVAGEKRAAESGLKLEGATWPLFQFLLSNQLGQNVVVVTARGQQEDFNGLFSYFKESGHVAANTTFAPHVFALSHHSMVDHDRKSLTNRKLSVLKHSIAEYDALAASSGSRKMVIVADDKPEYVTAMGTELMQMSQVATYRNLDFVLINTGTKEQRDGATFSHQAMFFRQGKVYELSPKFLDIVLKKNNKFISKSLVGGLACKSVLL